ncbi:MAG TPA: ABC transporter permease [Candidatus Dormibacteraeota bacterium]|nr:ABC transporter permease [Candidatus Dormibacteraeota bacterium]
MTGLPRLTFMELKLFLREPLAVFFAVAFPALLVGILGSVPGFREPKQDIGGLRVIDLYVPIAIAFVLVMLSLNLVPATLATYRERGILRRLATTPVGPTALLAAQMVMSLLMAVFAALLVLAVGRLAFDVAMPQQALGFALAFVLGAAAVFAMGLVLAAVVPTARSAQGFGTVLFFPMMFFAGLWVPRAAMPGTLRDISDFTPLGATVQALQDAAGGGWPQSLHLAVMAAYAAVFGLLAVRTFRWQ